MTLGSQHLIWDSLSARSPSCSWSYIELIPTIFTRYLFKYLYLSDCHIFLCSQQHFTIQGSLNSLTFIFNPSPWKRYQLHTFNCSSTIHPDISSFPNLHCCYLHSYYFVQDLSISLTSNVSILLPDRSSGHRHYVALMFTWAEQLRHHTIQNHPKHYAVSETYFYTLKFCNTVDCNFVFSSTLEFLCLLPTTVKREPVPEIHSP